MYVRRPIPDSASLVYAHSKVSRRLVGFAYVIRRIPELSASEPEKPSIPSLNVKQTMDLRKTFRKALGNMKPDEHQEMPGIDAPWYTLRSDIIDDISG